MVDIGRVGIIGGAGWLGHAIAKALIGSSTVSAERLICSFRSSKPESAVDCNWMQDNRQSVANSNVVILSVRPDDRNAIDVAAGATLVISVMAGVSVDDIKRRPGSSHVARALPNLAAEIGYSYTPFFVASPKPATGRPSHAIPDLWRCRRRGIGKNTSITSRRCRDREPHFRRCCLKP